MNGSWREAAGSAVERHCCAETDVNGSWREAACSAAELSCHRQRGLSEFIYRIVSKGDGFASLVQRIINQNPHFI